MTRYHHKIIGGRLVLRSLVLPKSGVYHARIRDSQTGRIYYRTTGEREKGRAERAAVAMAEGILGSIQAGGASKPRRFEDAYAEWLAELDIADSTRKEYRLTGRVFARHFRGLVHSVDRDAVKRFLAKRKKDGRSPRTIAKQLTQLRAFLGWCIDERYLSEDPTLRLKVASGQAREGIALTLEEARVLLEAARPVVKTIRDQRRGEWEQAVGVSYLRLFILLALHTGLRKSNILNLRWTQIDLEKRQIDIPADEMKKRRRHVVPIHMELVVALHDSVRGVGSTTAYVLGKKRGEIRKAFQGAVKRSGLPYALRVHDLRHTFSTWCQLRFPFLMAEHLCARKVKAVAGIYFHPSHEELLKAIDSLPWIERGPASVKADRSQGTA